jgi:hypothetical protein
MFNEVKWNYTSKNKMFSNRIKYQKIYIGGKARPARKADNLTAIYDSIGYKMCDPQHLATL